MFLNNELQHAGMSKFEGLTVTKVVFEYQVLLRRWSCYMGLTVTKVVFEFDIIIKASSFF